MKIRLVWDENQTYLQVRLVRDSRFGQLSNPLVRYLPGSKFVIEAGNYNETFTCDRVKRYLPLVTFKN